MLQGIVRVFAAMAGCDGGAAAAPPEINGGGLSPSRRQYVYVCQLFVVLGIWRSFMLGMLDTTHDDALEEFHLEQARLTLARNSHLPPRNDSICKSPEFDVPWMFGACPPTKSDSSIAYSHTSPLTCGLCRQINPYTRRFQKIVEKLAKKRSKCKGLVVYGVALGETHVDMVTAQNQTRTVDGNDLLKVHKRCFFTFVLKEELPKNVVEDDDFPLSGDAVDYLVPLTRQELPYANMRRNVKLLKLHPHLLFPWADRVIWQDAKFRRYDFEATRPTNYYQLFDQTVKRNNVCVTFMGIPIHKNTFGKSNLKGPHYTGEFHHHCDAIVEARAKRPTVTDSGPAIFNQCELYQQAFEDRDLSNGLIDSAMILWDQRKESNCLGFNSDLACTWSDEIQCHGDRDQVSFPFALLSMGVVAEKNPDPAHQDTIFYRKDQDTGEPTKPVLQIIQSQCHWYFKKPQPCVENATLAALTS